MATYAGNNCYLSIDGTVVTAYFIDVTLSPTNATHDTTAGSGTTHVEREPGLDDTTIDITLMYDAADVQTYIQKIGRHKKVSIEYGIEGNISGKPRHVQEFIISSAPHSTNVDKSPVKFSISGEAAAAASVDMYDGGVYS